MKTLNICPHHKLCGGCNYQGIDYFEQLKLKQKTVDGLLSKFGKVENIIPAPNFNYYRNKAHGTFGTNKNEIIAGIYQPNSHKLIAIDNCQIINPIANNLINDIKKLIKSFKFKVYNEDSKEGFFRHVLIRTGEVSKQVLVVLVVSDVVFPSKNNFVKALIKQHPEITSVVMNINNKKTSMVLGDREIVLYGKGFIEDVLCGKKFRISPKSFYQINSVQTEVLYNKAIELANLSGSETLIDAYCGIGTIGIVASDKAKNVIGVELNKDAVKDAISNSKINGVKNIKFIQADAGEFMVDVANNNGTVDVLFMDPPRTGASESFLLSAIKLKPKKMVYISCNPETLARDLQFLVKGKYRIEKMIPVDMFPNTQHCEIICLLSQNILPYNAII